MRLLSMSTKISGVGPLEAPFKVELDFVPGPELCVDSDKKSIVLGTDAIPHCRQALFQVEESLNSGFLEPT
jgi:hypothetical protein